MYWKRCQTRLPLWWGGSGIGLFGWTNNWPLAQRSWWTGIQWMESMNEWSQRMESLSGQYIHLSSGLIPNLNSSLFVTIILWISLNWNSLSFVSLQMFFKDLNLKSCPRCRCPFLNHLLKKSVCHPQVFLCCWTKLYLVFGSNCKEFLIHFITWLCLTRTGNYQIHEFDWLKWI